LVKKTVWIANIEDQYSCAYQNHRSSLRADADGGMNKGVRSFECVGRMHNLLGGEATISIGSAVWPAMPALPW
jgi:hypothetical protein